MPPVTARFSTVTFDAGFPTVQVATAGVAEQALERVSGACCAKHAETQMTLDLLTEMPSSRVAVTDTLTW